MEMVSVRFVELYAGSIAPLQVRWAELASRECVDGIS